MRQRIKHGSEIKGSTQICSQQSSTVISRKGKEKNWMLAIVLTIEIIVKTSPPKQRKVIYLGPSSFSFFYEVFFFNES